MGYVGDGGYRNGRAPHGDKERFPFPAYTGKHGAVARAEPDSSVLLASAREL